MFFTSKEQTSDDRLLTKINSWRTAWRSLLTKFFADENFLLYSRKEIPKYLPPFSFSFNVKIRLLFLLHFLAILKDFWLFSFLATVPGLFPLGCFDSNPMFEPQRIGCIEPLACATICRHSSFLFSSLQGGNTCSCAHTLHSSASVLNVTQCAVLCEGDAEQVCGGPTSVNIFATNLAGSTCSRLECIPGYVSPFDDTSQ